MSAALLKASHLGKAFRTYRSEWQRTLSWFGSTNAPAYDHWVLRDVSFSLSAGEAIGVVGKNGAGKSTLLKLVAGTLRPTEGTVEVAGRVAALLELGLGFNPEFTGRQNALHAAGLMGYERSAIQAAMEEIESFADIGDYFDQAVRTYSSGMQVRVAFAVATAFRPDVLVVDEALAVGDAAFQRKCFRRIESFRGDGTALLIVSHDTETLKKLCSRAVLISGGRVELSGPAKLVCDEYERQLFGGRAIREPAAPSQTWSHFDPSLATAACEVVYGNGQAQIDSCWIENRDGEPINVAASGQPLVWLYRVRFNQSIADPVFAMMVKTKEGVALYGVDSTQLDGTPRTYTAGEIAEIRFDLSNCLAPGVYYFNCGVRVTRGGAVEFLSRRIDATILRVVESPNPTVKEGLLDMRASLTITSAANDQRVT